MTFNNILKYSIRPILTSGIVIVVVLVGLFVLIIDRKELKDTGKKKDAKLAKGIGISYIIAGPVLYLIGRII